MKIIPFAVDIGRMYLKPKDHGLKGENTQIDVHATGRAQAPVRS
jgi:hypothetical protein